ncbi:MAG: hypothetical protein LDL41_05560 [Coleofasciculus sp. S288]|nr:hypothetical protein [Coleofasciculus sp. S288]
MKIIKTKKNHGVTLVVLNQKDELVDASQSPGSNSIHQERLRQSRIKFNLASTLIVVSATFCFTGITLFWSGTISEETAIRTVDLVSRIVTSYCLPLIKSAGSQLDESTKELKDDTQD